MAYACWSSRFLLGCAFSATLAMAPSLHAEDAPKPLTIALPGTSELDKLADLTAQFAGVSIQYNPQKLRGTVRLSVRGQVTPAELWAVFNQVLVSQGFTTVVVGLPPVYQVVPLNEAAGLSAALNDEDAVKLPYQPGFAVVVHALKHLGSDAAVKALGPLFANQTGQVRTLGPDDHRIVLSASQDRLRDVRRLLAFMDRPGVVPEVRLFRPLRAAPQALQASATTAWTSLGRIGEQPRLAEIQVAPDAVQLVLIASADDIGALEALAQSLDNAEPIETRTYRPRYFGIEEVANLLQQIVRSERQGAPTAELIRDKLTNSLIVKATVAQHKRVEDVIRTLDETPAAARRQVRTFSVKNRQADEMAKVITGLVSGGLVPSAADTPPMATEPMAPAPGPQLQTPLSAPVPAAPPAPPGMTITGNGQQENGLVIAADVVTNRLIVLGDPRVLDQVAVLLRELDQRQPQVELEVILVTLSASQSRDLGVELGVMFQHNAVSGTVTSLFGLSTAPVGNPLARTVTTAGLGGVVLNPGDFAGVLKALETINDGHSVIRSRVVANNNAKASINGVVQEPLVSNNSTTTVSTTSVTGTTDAGTQIMITPQISAADYVTLTYAITQSAFLGASTRTTDGTPIPPAKSSDTLSSVATIPDGFIISLGGLSTRTTGHSESRIPFLGGIPLLGELFKARNDTTSDARFYVFIRASVMRHASFADLKRSSAGQVGEAGLREKDWPTLEPRLTK